MVKVVKKASVSAADLLAVFQKDLGNEIGSFGGHLINRDRIPTGLFPLDLALAGGFPRGKCSIIYGPESSNKTNIALLTIASSQKLFPHLTCVFVDVEHSFDPDWATKMGVDVSKLIVIAPSYAEQAVDIVEAFLMAEDTGLVVVDSLAAMVTSSEAESSADKALVGGAALVCGKLARRSTHALQEAAKAGRYPTLIYINQISYKIGVMFGDPETQPGGKKPQFQSSLTLRCFGKNEMDPKVSSVMPVRKAVKFIVRKHKVPILAASGEFDMVTYPHNGLTIGQCDDFKQIKGYLETFGMFEKGEKGKGWIIVGDHYDTQAAFEQKLHAEPLFGNEIRQAIIERVSKEEGLIDSEAD